MRLMMTLDAVGGVWRYAVDLAAALADDGVACLLVGSGPRPDKQQRQACEALPNTMLYWTDLPLDWMVDSPAELDAIAPTLLSMADCWGADLIHLNLPSQAAAMKGRLPVVVASHSCLPTWWQAVKTDPMPAGWQWQRSINRQGFDRASAVLVPTFSHGQALSRAYGAVPNLTVVPNATASRGSTVEKEAFVLAAGRWWDEAKGLSILDAASQLCSWPVVLAGSTAGPNGTNVTIDHATPVGLLSSDMMWDHMQRAAIFTSAALYEPFGLAVLEAASSGAALVLSDIPTFRELWDGAAIFVPTRDPDRLAAAINYLAGNAIERQTFSERALERAKTFTLARQKGQVLKAYSQAIAAKVAMA